MRFTREIIEFTGNKIKKYIESKHTDKNGITHWENIQKELITKMRKYNNAPNLMNLLLSHPDIKNNRDKFTVSNAAGMNKEGLIPPQFLYDLGLDRVVVGTVTARPWLGTQVHHKVNNYSRIILIPKTGDAANCQGLPGNGAEIVKRNLQKHGKHNVSITLNFMATPDPSYTLDDKLADCEKTMNILRNHYDRLEFNYSCPNTTESHNLEDLDAYLEMITGNALNGEEIYIKLGPRTTENQARLIMETAQKHSPLITGFTLTNSDPLHNHAFWGSGNKDPKGGLTGNSLYKQATKIHTVMSDINQIYFNGEFNLIGVGGINSKYRADERLAIPNTKEVQLYTALMHTNAARFLRELKR